MCMCVLIVRCLLILCILSIRMAASATAATAAPSSSWSSIFKYRLEPNEKLKKTHNKQNTNKIIEWIIDWFGAYWKIELLNNENSMSMRVSHFVALFRFIFFLIFHIFIFSIFFFFCIRRSYFCSYISFSRMFLFHISIAFVRVVFGSNSP